MPPSRARLPFVGKRKIFTEDILGNWYEVTSFHLIGERFHGVLAPSARDRDKIVPQQEPSDPSGEDRSPCPHHMP